jgi:hypothetical protein
MEQQTERPIGWIGCVPVLTNDDLDMLAFKKQYEDPSQQSPSMRKCASFDDWVRYCTACASMIILQMINTVDAGEAPPKACIIASQIQEAQRQLVALRNSGNKVLG